LLKLNNASTVYVPQSSFTAVANGPTVNAATLPPFTGTTQYAPKNMRLLANHGDPAWPTAAGLEAGDYLVDQNGRVAYRIESNFPTNLRVEEDQQLTETETLKGPQAADDSGTYRVWYRLDPAGGPAQKFLVDQQGVATYLVDPGINGTRKVRPDGSAVTKFDAPKATLMSYIIKGILSRKLPWALVLLGVMIAIVLEMSGIPSLAFAVGVYLPLSSSSPIFIGGLVRWLVDRWLRRTKFKSHQLTDEELVAEGDKSPGVLLASGYIAGGALAGIVIAFMAGVPSLVGFSTRVEEWSTASNPFFNGPNSDWLAMLPFLVICVLLYLVGRDVLLANRRRTTPR
ncbi:MAG: OPT/YSL family transporter, partial [Verrucomicrobiota bacterium]|nr:OPT/YSL family transporter [Verrucomicrobiota bacterium]